MTHHVIPLDRVEGDTYGVMYKSRNVYQTRHSNAPTRVNVWLNPGHPNEFLGKQLGDMVGKGHNAQHITEWFLNNNPDALTAPYQDPHNNPTHDHLSFLLTTESSAICSTPGLNTGQPGSGQVYATGEKLGHGDTATLVYPDGTPEEVIFRFKGRDCGNGHGVAEVL